MSQQHWREAYVKALERKKPKTTKEQVEERYVAPKQRIPPPTYTPLLSRVGERGPEYILVRGKDPKQVMLEPMKQVQAPTRTVRVEPTYHPPISRYGLYGPEYVGERKEYKVRAAYYGSKRFYRELGYPELAGKFEAFTIPKGYKVEAITKTPTGLEVTFKAPEEAKGIAETILSWKFPSYKGPSLMEILGIKKKEIPMTATSTEMARISGITVHPLAPIAGVIASVESPAYILGRLAGLPTPRPPPTLTGGLIGKGLEAGLGWKSTEFERTMAYGPQYAVGTIFGDIFVSYVTGKAVSKLARPLTTRVSAKAQSWLTEKYIEKGPWAWKGLKEKAVMRITGARPYLARGEVGLPSLVQPVSLSQLQASQISWELTHAPRMGGVWLRNIGLAPTKTKVLPHLIARGGAISIGYLRELGFEEPMWKRGLLPFVTQKQVTRMGIIPYIPKTVAVIGKKGVSQFLLGFALTTIVKTRKPIGRITPIRLITPSILQPIQKRKAREGLFPKVWWPTLAYAREKFRPFTIEKPRAKERERLIPVMKLPPFQIPRREIKQPILPIPKQIPKQIPISPQIVTQIPQIPIPTPTIPTVPTPIIPPFRLPRGGRDVSRGRRGLFGLWFKREHPMKTYKEMWRTFSLTPKKPKRRKGKKRKKKRVGEVKLFGF